MARGSCSSRRAGFAACSYRCGRTVWADESLEKPRCDAAGTRVVFARGMVPVSAFGSDVFVVDVDGGEPRALTTDHTAGAATFSADGTTVIYASRRNGTPQLYEMPVTGGPSRQLTFGDSASTAPDVSRDGKLLLFAREVNLFSIYGGEAGGKPSKVTSRRETLYNVRPISADRLIAERAEGAGNTVVVVDVADGNVRTLVRGYLPFPSRDGTRVFYRAVDDPRRLEVIPLAGGTATRVAELPGRITLGHDAPDGQHVQLDRAHVIESWRVAPDGKVHSDEVRGILVPSANGTWSYVQRADDNGNYELSVRGPGPTRTVRTEAWVNTWLDDHRLAFAAEDELVILDAATGARTTIPAAGHVNITSVLAPDGKHWFDSQSISRVTRHVIVRFDER
jgi:hypothetical protein